MRLVDLTTNLPKNSKSLVRFQLELWCKQIKTAEWEIQNELLHLYVCYGVMTLRGRLRQSCFWDAGYSSTGASKFVAAVALKFYWSIAV
jgi:hypothetical protein